MTEALVLLLEQYGEIRARRLVASIGCPKSKRAFEEVAAVVLARRLLADGVDPQIISHRLAARFTVSVKTAQRRMHLAGWDGKS